MTRNQYIMRIMIILQLTKFKIIKKQLQERFSKKRREFQMKTITYIEPSSGPSFNISLVLFATIDFTSFIGGKVNTRDLTLESFPLTSPVEAFPLLLLQHF